MAERLHLAFKEWGKLFHGNAAAALLAVTDPCASTTPPSVSTSRVSYADGPTVVYGDVNVGPGTNNSGPGNAGTTGDRDGIGNTFIVIFPPREAGPPESP